MTSFLALLARMKYINRWSLMHNTQNENLSQHTLECAFLAHFLAVVGNEYFGKCYDEERVAVAAMYHDASEILTGDLPTPIKYYNEAMRRTYKSIEAEAEERLLERLPPELQARYSVYFGDSLPEDERKLIKTADKLCAYIKCEQELAAGNGEFTAAKKAISGELERRGGEELGYFLENCLPAFTMTLDELNGEL